MNPRVELLAQDERLRAEGHPGYTLECLVKWLPKSKVEKFLADFKRLADPPYSVLSLTEAEQPGG